MATSFRSRTGATECSAAQSGTRSRRSWRAPFFAPATGARSGFLPATNHAGGGIPRPPESKSPTASRNLERERRIAGRNSGSIWRSAMGYVNLVPRDPSTPLRFAQMTAITASVARTFPEILCSFLCLGRSNCDRGREDKCRQAKLAKASFKNFAPEIGAILGLHPQIIARHGGVSVMTWR